MLNAEGRDGSNQAQSLVPHHFVDEMRIHAAKPFANRAQEIHMQATGRELEKMLKCLLFNGAEQSRLCRRGHGGARLVLEQRHLAEKVTLFNITQDLLAPTAILFGNFDRALAHQVQRIAGIALVEYDVDALKFENVYLRSNLL